MTGGRTFGTVDHLFAGSLWLCTLPLSGTECAVCDVYRAMMVPFQAFVIQEFLLIDRLEWRNTFYALIIPGTFSAFALFMLRQAFLQIPLELEEAAISMGQILCSAVVYHAAAFDPDAGSLWCYYRTAAWNDFLWPLVVSNSPDTRLSRSALRCCRGSVTPLGSADDGFLYRYRSMLILFLLLQRYSLKEFL